MRKCDYCGERFEVKIFNAKACDKESCQQKHYQEILDRQKEKERLKLRKTPNLTLKSIQRNKAITKSVKIDELQSVINKIALAIDVNLLCPVTYFEAVDAGHCHSRGANSNMRYNLHNIHRQSRQSNSSHNDDVKLREALSKEYGTKYVEFLQICRSTPIIKISESDRKFKIGIAFKLLFEIKNMGEYFDTKERIDLRNRVNEKLGIYPGEFCFFNIN